MITSYFWSAGATGGAGAALTVGVALVAAAAGLAVGYLINHMTAAGAHLPPADGAEVAAEPCQAGTAGGSAGPDRAAPAPSAPVEGAGALGVTPDPIGQHLTEAAALLGQDDCLPDDDDAVDVIRWRAVDLLANARLAEDDDTAIAWESRARDLLADQLVPGELIELLITYMLRDADVRASALLAGVEMIAAGGTR